MYCIYGWLMIDFDQKGLYNYVTMRKAHTVKITLPLSPDDQETKITFVCQSMAQYPQHLQNLSNDYLLSGQAEAKTKLDLLANFRSEINFWCRDNCQSPYRLEEMFEIEGLRVYFADVKDHKLFESVKQCVLPPTMPEVVRNQYS